MIWTLYVMLFTVKFNQMCYCESEETKSPIPDADPLLYAVEDREQFDIKD
jgi:hypothetical protein